MGWDDNGLPTERRVQNHFGVRCDPSVALRPGLRSRPAEPSEQRAGVDLAAELRRAVPALTETDEQAFEELWRTLGLSVDWSMTYTTIGALAQRISQRSFLGLLARGAGLPAARRRRCGTSTSRRPSPRPSSRTASARGRCTACASPDRPSAPGRPTALIETTRPELIPACVALLAHPDDERHRELVGSEVLTPLFGTRVPVLTHPLVEPREGHRPGDGVHVRRPHRRDVVARAGAAGALGARPRRAPAPRSRGAPPGWESEDPARARASYGELQGQHDQPGAQADRRAAASSRAT